jgi:uncharacterized MAPEG superfamily protein
MLHYPLVLALSAGLAWLMIITSSVLRAKMWTLPGLRYSLGNREKPPDFDTLAGRADRAARNMLENMPLLLAVVMAVCFAGRANDPKLDLGASVFFWSRLVYWPVYLVGIQGVRSTLWVISVVGLFIAGAAIL